MSKFHSKTPFHHSQKVWQSHVVWYHTCLPTTLAARDRNIKEDNKIGELRTFHATVQNGYVVDLVKKVYGSCKVYLESESV